VLAKHAGAGWVSREPSPIPLSGAGHRPGPLGPSAKGQRRGGTDPCNALHTAAPRVRSPGSCSGGLGGPPSSILRWELSSRAACPGARRGLCVGRCPAAILGGLRPANISAHRLRLGGHQRWEPPASQRDLSALPPPYLSEPQHPSRITSLRCQALLCLGKKINKPVPGSLGARSAAGSQHLSPFPAASPAGAWVRRRAGRTSTGRKLLPPRHNGHGESRV